MQALSANCAKRQVLRRRRRTIDALDETVRVDVPALIKRFRRHDNFGLIALIGVQSNRILARFICAAVPRGRGRRRAGPLHVSGCLSMLDGSSSSTPAASSASRCSPAKPRAGSTAYCAMPLPFARSTIT